jgi:hypothetical protein
MRLDHPSQFGAGIINPLDLASQHPLDHHAALPLDHVQQFVLAREVGVEGPHAQAGLCAQIPEAHGLESLLIAESQGGIEDFHQVLDRYAFLLDLDTLSVAKEELPAQVLHGQTHEALECLEC